MACLDTHDCHGIEGSFMTKIASDIAGGLLYLHGKGIAHRDLKPANVLVSNHHYREEKDRDKLAYAWSHQPVICKLTDFGESRSLVLQTRSVCQSRKLSLMSNIDALIQPVKSIIRSVRSVKLKK